MARWPSATGGSRRERSQPAFSRPLLVEAAGLFCFASMSVGAGHPPHLNSFSMTSLICFGMGVQNALVTKLSVLLCGLAAFDIRLGLGSHTAVAHPHVAPQSAAEA